MRKKPQPDIYFFQFVSRFRAEAADQWKTSTQISSKPVFNQLVLEFGGKKLSELTSRDFQIFFTKIAKTKAPSTVRKTWAVLSNVLRYAEEQGLITGFKKPRLPRSPRTPQRWLTLDEMKLMIAKSEGPIKVLIMLLAETGMRVGEALALQTRHVTKDSITIDQNVYAGLVQTPKTDSSHRTIAISSQLWYGLSKLMAHQEPDTFIFPWQKYDKVRLEINKVFDRAGIPRKGEHAFRRGNITWLIRDLEVPLIVVSDRIGHSPGGMTLGVYVQKVPGQDKAYIPAIERGLYE